MDFRESRLREAVPSPLTTTSYSLLRMVTVVASVPVSSARTAAPTEAAVSPYWAAASRFRTTFTWGTWTDRELSTSTASGSLAIWAFRSLAIISSVS